MDELIFRDVNCAVGLSPLDGTEPGVKELLAEMDYYGVAEALVKHNNFDFLGALQCNIELAEMLEEFDPDKRLSCVWGILPEQCGELPEPDEFFRQMAAARSKALMLSPDAHRYIACRRTIGKLMDAAAERNIPVFLDKLNYNAQGMAGWQKIYDFMEIFPENIFILCDFPGKWGNDRLVRPLLEGFPKFYFCTSGYWNVRGLGEYAQKYGADRLLYGSGFPFYNHGSQMPQIKFSGLSDAENAMIAGGNMKKLMDEVLL